MQTLTGFVVVWSLLAPVTDGVSPVRVSSHYYWSEAVCEAAKVRLNQTLTESGSEPLAATCVPFAKEDATPTWVTSNVIGPCEPHYYDCGDLTASSVSEVLAHEQAWYEIARRMAADPNGAPIGPRHFLTPEQQAKFRRQPTR